MMTSETKKYQVSILDETYSLVSDEPEELVNSSMDFIKELVNEISKKSGTLDDKKILAFALIKSAIKMNVVNSELSLYRKKINELEELLNRSALLD